MANNSIILDLIVVLQLMQFYTSLHIVFTERMLTHSDYLQRLAETLFYLGILTFAGFWYGDGEPSRNISIYLVGAILGATLMVNINNVFRGENIDFKAMFAQSGLSSDALMGVKNIIVSLSFFAHIGFLTLLWMGGLFTV